MRDFPSGTVTFLFTDVEGSTRRWEADSPAMLAAVEHHFALLDAAITANNGVRFKVIGDAIQAAFPTALDGLRAAVAGQRALVSEDWGSVEPMRVRMALHTGSATPRDGDYLAPSLNRLARLLGAGAGGQILLTEATRNLVRDDLPPGIELLDIGEHRLRDLRESERVFQVVAEGLPRDFPPLQSVDRPTTNLPAQLTSFIGREREVAEIAQRLSDPAIRLLTLTGPGGTGKTRLALRAASELMPAFADGVWFIALAPLAHVRLVPSAIAEALGVRETAGEPAEQTLQTYLKSKQLLLILDNFEHVVQAGPLVSDLLANCPRLQILATSRAPLRVSGEHELPILPLTLPEDDSDAAPEASQSSEAIRLFVDRVKAVRPDFVLDERNAATVAAICRRLDGLPLAIELAAARIRLLSPEAILSRLDSRLTLLTGGDRDRPERQQTLRAAIAWSHDLLDADAQVFFRRLAVFVDGWTLEAAEAVALATPPALSALDCLASLSENSLIQRIDLDGDDDASEPRFTMLQTIREFAREQLEESEDRDAIADAHAAYFLKLAIEAEPHLSGPEAVQWLNRLDVDHENLRAALEQLREHHDATLSVQLAAALWRFWWLRGHLSEGREQLEATLAVAEPDATNRDFGAALDGAGVLAETQGDYDSAEAYHQHALSLARGINDRVAIARALGNLGVVAADRGMLDEAAVLLEESLSVAREAGQTQLVATALNDLGGVAHNRGDLRRAEEFYQESLALRRKGGSGSDMARSLNNMGFIALKLQEFGRARGLFEESLALYREGGDKWGAAGPLNGLAMAFHLDGDLVRAMNLHHESLALFRETGDARNAAIALVNLAFAALATGHLDDAAGYFRESLAGFVEVNDKAGIVQGLAGIGRVLARGGQFETAARLLAASNAIAISGEPDEGAPDPGPGDSDIDAIRSALGDKGFLTAWQYGGNLSAEAAVAEASKALAPVQ